MTRHWDERLHPRDPANGEFVDSHWASRLSGIVGHTAAGPTLANWKEGSVRAAHQEMQDRAIELVADDPDLAGDSRETILGKLAQHGLHIPTPVAVYHSGPHRIVVATNKKVPVERLQRIIGDLQRGNPSRHPINLWVVPRRHMMIDGAGAETISGTGFIRLADDSWNEKEYSSFVNNDPEYFMPQAQHHNSLEYVLAHEWGHVTDYPDIPGGDQKAQDYLRYHVRQDLSEYGSRNAAEARAEAFAEWWLSRGETDNEAALAYADMYQWRA